MPNVTAQPGAAYGVGRLITSVMARVIEAEIRAGQWTPGNAVPSRKQLAERFGIAQETAVGAHAWLARGGYLVAVPGVGMAVTPANRWPEKTLGDQPAASRRAIRASWAQWSPAPLRPLVATSGQLRAHGRDFEPCPSARPSRGHEWMGYGLNPSHLASGYWNRANRRALRCLRTSRVGLGPRTPSPLPIHSVLVPRTFAEHRGRHRSSQASYP
jgi:DNA-binding transcriptional MocR family regulator